VFSKLLTIIVDFDSPEGANHERSDFSEVSKFGIIIGFGNKFSENPRNGFPSLPRDLLRLPNHGLVHAQGEFCLHDVYCWIEIWLFNPQGRTWSSSVRYQRRQKKNTEKVFKGRLMLPTRRLVAGCGRQALAKLGLDVFAGAA
jgi:hypothetical protein